MRAPWYVLPEPGGPWTARYEPLPGSSRLGGRRSSRSRTARCGPGASIPWSATHSATAAIALRKTLVGTGVPGISARGWSPADCFALRLRSRRPRASSIHTISPAFFCVAGSKGSDPTENLWSCGLELVAEDRRLLLLAHLLLGLEAADALAVVDEVVVALVLDPVVVRPPLGLLLAAVPVHEVGEQSVRRGARPRGRRQPLRQRFELLARARSSSSDASPSRAIGRGIGAELRLGLGAASLRASRAGSSVERQSSLLYASISSSFAWSCDSSHAS